LQEKKRSRWEGADRRLVERIFLPSFLVLEWYYYLAILVQKVFEAYWECSMESSSSS
jgi:hypothetical protein